MKKFAMIFLLSFVGLSGTLLSQPPEVFKYGYDEKNSNVTRTTPQFFLDYALNFQKNYDPKSVNVFLDLDGVLTNKTSPDLDPTTVKPRGHMPGIARFLHDLGFNVFIISGWHQFDETITKVKKLGMEWVFKGETESKETFQDLAPLLKEQEGLSLNMPSDTRYLRMVRQGNVLSFQYVEKKIDENYYKSAHRVGSNNNKIDPHYRAKWMASQICKSEHVFFVEDSHNSVVGFQKEIQKIADYDNIKSLHLFLFSIINGSEVAGDIVPDQHSFSHWLMKQNLCTGKSMSDYNESKSDSKNEVKIPNNTNLYGSSSRISQTPPMNIASKKLEDFSEDDSSEDSSDFNKVWINKEDSLPVGSPANKNGLPRSISSSFNLPPDIPTAFGLFSSSELPKPEKKEKYSNKDSSLLPPQDLDPNTQFAMDDIRDFKEKVLQSSINYYQSRKKLPPEPESSTDDDKSQGE